MKLDSKRTTNGHGDLKIVNTPTVDAWLSFEGLSFCNENNGRIRSHFSRRVRVGDLSSERRKTWAADKVVPIPVGVWQIT